MLANAELSQDFFILNQQYKRLVAALLEIVDVPSLPLEIEATDNALLRGLESDKIYHIESGSLSARYRDRTVFLLDDGDLLLPDVTGVADSDVAVSYASENGASLHGYSAQRPNGYSGRGALPMSSATAFRGSSFSNSTR